jgi:4-amino-4-deoxy-L-arabinose transferase-like glycosyltransferase
MTTRTDALPLNWNPARAKKGKLLFLLAVPLFLYVVLLPVMPLTEPDESRYSDIPSLMNHSGDYVTPRLNHVVYLEKPPLAYWATAFFFKAFGENEFSSRLFSGLCAWGCILLVYAMGAYLYDEKTGLYSAGVMSTFLYHFALGRLNLLDLPLTFFVGLAIWAGYLHFEAHGRKKRWIYFLYLSSALAFLTKGLIGIVFPFAIVGIWLLAQRRWRDLVRIFNLPGILLFLVIAAPWVILVQKANPDFLGYFFIRQHFLRYATDAYGKVNVFYYLPVILFGTIPWLPFFLQILRNGRGRTLLLTTARQGLLLSWMIFILLFFSISSSKMITYIAPFFLPLAILFGRVFRIHPEHEAESQQREDGGPFRPWPIWIQSFILFLLLFVPPFLNEYAVPFREWLPFVALPALLLLLTALFAKRICARWNAGGGAAFCLLSALFLGSIVFPLSHFLTPHKSSLPVARAIQKFVPSGEEIYQYRIYLRGINFYCKMRTPIIGRPDEIATGRDLLPPGEKERYFLSVDKFLQIGKEKGDVYCITKGKDKFEHLGKRVPHLKVIWKNSAFYLIHLRFRPEDKDPS